MLSVCVYSSQILSPSPCLYVLGMSPSQQGIIPSMTVQQLSSCLAACRELYPMIYLFYSVSLLLMCSFHCRSHYQALLVILNCFFFFLLFSLLIHYSTFIYICAFSVYSHSFQTYELVHVP